MSNSIAIRPQMNITEAEQTARHMVASGFFQDAKSASQAVVKVLAGQELGLGPFASMTGIHIIKGKPALGANLIATLIKNDPRYDYIVREHTDTVCRIEFHEGKQVVGESTFTAADARKAGTKNMDRYPRNMLFARAISNGARWYTPGIFGGTPVYTPEELGADVDEDGYIVGEVVDSGPKWETSSSVSDQGPIAEDLTHGSVVVSPDIVVTDLRQSDLEPVDDYLFAKTYGEFTKAYAAASDYYDNAHHVFGTIQIFYDGEIKPFMTVRHELANKLEEYATLKGEQQPEAA